MSKEQVTVDVEKEAYELFQAFSTFVKAVKTSLDDGFQLEKDIPMILGTAVPAMLSAVSNLNKLGDDWAEDPTAFIKAAVIGGADIAGVFLKK